MSVLAGYAIVAAVAFFVIFNTKVALLVGRMARAENRVDVIENGTSVLADNPTYALESRWCGANGFTPFMMADLFQLAGTGRSTIGIWKTGARKTYLYREILQGRVVHQFVTALDEDRLLVSGSSKNAKCFPDPPWVYSQAFHGLPLDALYEKHVEGLDYLERHWGVSVVERPDVTKQVMCDAMKRKAAYLKTIPLWQARGVYWFFVRKHVLNNKGVASLFPAARQV